MSINLKCNIAWQFEFIRSEFDWQELQFAVEHVLAQESDPFFPHTASEYQGPYLWESPEKKLVDIYIKFDREFCGLKIIAIDKALTI